jgi:hypothetical protein
MQPTSGRVLARTPESPCWSSSSGLKKLANITCASWKGPHMPQKNPSIILTNTAKLSDGVDRILLSIKQNKSTKSRFLNDIAAAITDGKSTWGSLSQATPMGRSRRALPDRALLDPDFEKKVLQGNLGVTIIGCPGSPMQSEMLDLLRNLAGLTDDGKESYIGAIAPFDPFGATTLPSEAVLSFSPGPDDDDLLVCRKAAPSSEREKRIVQMLNQGQSPTPIRSEFNAIAGVISSCLTDGPTAGAQMAMIDGSLSFVLGENASRNFGHVAILVDGSGLEDVSDLEERATLPLSFLKSTGLFGKDDEKAALRYAWIEEIDADLMARASRRGIAEDLMQRASVVPPGPNAPRAERRRFAAEMNKLRKKRQHDQ